MSVGITLAECRSLLIAALIGTCAMFGTDIHLASMPFIQQAMHATETQMQHSVSFYFLGMMISMPFYGIFSDYYGRKPLMIIGLSIAAVSSLWITQSQDITEFLCLRLMQGLGTGCGMSIGRTILSDVLSAKKLSIYGSYFAMIVSVSPIIAPGLGGYVQQHYDWHLNFLIMAVWVLLVLLLVITMFTETNQQIHPHRIQWSKITASYLSLVENKHFMCACALTGLIFSLQVIYATVSAYLFEVHFGLSPIAFGSITMVLGAANFCGKFVNTLVVNRYGTRSALFRGCALVVISGVLQLLAWIIMPQVWQMIVILLVIGTFGIMWVMPNSMVLSISTVKSDKGVAMSMYAIVQMLCSFISSSIVAVLLYSIAAELALAYILFGAISMGFLVYLQRIEAAS